MKLRMKLIKNEMERRQERQDGYIKHSSEWDLNSQALFKKKKKAHYKWVTNWP